MKFIFTIRREEGYTLVETLVAMGLFVGVLIPVATFVGNLMIDRTSDRLNKSFHLATTEMNLVAKEIAVSDRDRQQGGYSIRTRAVRTGNLVEVEVSVSAVESPEKNLILLTKSLLEYK